MGRSVGNASACARSAGLPLKSIAEGRTDQRVIDNIVCGLLSGDDEGLSVVDVQPPFQPPDSPGGWTLVHEALQRGEVGSALTFNDFVIVHIDVCEHPGFDVMRRADGRERTVDELIDAVVVRLQTAIGEIALTHHDRIIFAVAVNSIECWLLLLLFESQNTKGCKDHRLL